MRLHIGKQNRELGELHRHGPPVLRGQLPVDVASVGAQRRDLPLLPLDPIIRAIWIKNSRISLERQITKSVLVCSRHFRRLDFNTIRNGKYLLKPRVFPTVFPWGKMDTAEIEADQRALQHASVEGTTETPGNAQSSTNDDVIKATVDQIVAQILSESAERKATEEGKTGKAADDVKNTPESGEDANKAAARNPQGLR